MITITTFTVEINWGGTEFKEGVSRETFWNLEDARDFLDTNLATSVAEIEYNEMDTTIMYPTRNSYVVLGDVYSFWETGKIVENNVRI